MLESFDNTGIFLFLLSSAYIESRAFLLLTTPPVKSCRQEVERGQSQDNCPQLIKGTFHVIWHHAQYIRVGGSSCMRNMITVMAFVIPSKLYAYRTLGSGERIPYLRLLPRMIFALSIKLSLCQPSCQQVLWLLAFLFPSHSSVVGEGGFEQHCGAWCWLELNHTVRIAHSCPEKRSAHTA